MKVVRNNIIPFKGFSAINIFGTLFCRKGANISQRTLNHESIHTAQMKELLYIPFYPTYVIEWLVYLIKYSDTNKAYHAISFEKEAYTYQDDEEYLKTRKHYAQWRK